MTRTNQEVSSTQAGWSQAVGPFWHGPCARITLMHSWLKKVAAAALPCFCPLLGFAESKLRLQLLDFPFPALVKVVQFL